MTPMTKRFTSKYFDWNNFNMAKPTVYRRHSGYCAPEMYVDPAGLTMHEEGECLWFRNHLIRDCNNTHGDVIAVIPVTQALAVYEMLRQKLQATGNILDENNMIVKDDPEEASGHPEAGDRM